MLFFRQSKPLMIFSMFANMLMLAVPLHMLQVYDRVLSSGSKETLLYITLIAAVALVLFGICEATRSRLAQRQAASFTVDNAEALFGLVANNGYQSGNMSNELIRHFNTARSFLASKSHISLYDLPFAPFFLVLLFLVHWQIGLLTLFGAAFLVIVAVLNKQFGQEAEARSNDANSQTINFATTVVTRAEEIRAMGLAPNLMERWKKLVGNGLQTQEEASRRSAGFHGISRTTRQLLQVVIMAWGAWLVLNNDMSGGLIFAASMISSRALQPIEQIIGGWDSLNRARQAFESLDEHLEAQKEADAPIQQPAPIGHLNLSDVSYASETSSILESVSFSVKPGDLVSIVGPSGAGKSTLVRLITGAIRPTGGKIELDGCDLRNWPSEQLGRYVGYVAQDVMLFPGSIAENIARMALAPIEQQVIGAAKMAGVHDLINAMPDGYQTLVHSGEFRLSGGQLQRIALARALYSSPRLLVLDEPNAHLDPAGEANLFEVLKRLKSNGVTIILVTQRGALQNLATRTVRIQNGRNASEAGSGTPAFRPAAAGGQAGAQAMRMAPETAPPRIPVEA
jgi:ATP-binding cassette subfamily C protein